MPTFEIQLLIFSLKICLIMTVSWCIRFALGQRNPKGIVLLWRIHFVALLLVCTGMFFPPLWNLKSQPSNAVELADATRFSVVEPISLPIDDIPFLHELPSANALPELISSMACDLETRIDASIVQAPMFSERMQDANFMYFKPRTETAEVDDSSNVASATVPSTESVVNDRARTLSNGLMWLWLIGVAFGLFRLLWLCVWIRSVSGKARDVRLDPLSLPLSLGSILISKNVRIMESTKVYSPCLIGVLRPVILLPKSLLKRSGNASACHSAIAHELMHVQGCDMLWHILLQVQQAILWPMPLAWWISRSHLFACERVCDESASTLTQDREQYRSDLAKLALAVLHTNHQTFSLSMVKKPEITRRLALLAQRPPILQVGLREKSVLMGTILVGILLGATGSSDYEDNQPEPSPKSIEINSMEVADTEAIVGVQHQTPNADEATETVDVPIAANTQPDQSTAVSTITKKTIADSETPKANHQAFTVHSHLQPVFPAPSKAGPVNSGQIIHGRVTDIDGLPIPNATLAVGMFSFDAPAALPKNKPMPLVKITTDINGNWNWNQAIAVQALGLRVAKDGYISSSFEFAEGKTAYDIQLAKAISVKGILVDENGQPVQGLRIFADPYLQFLSRETQSPSRMSAKETDSHGNWQVDNWYEESISLTALAKDGRIAKLENVNARSEQLLKFKAAKTVRFRVIDSAQNPIVGARVRGLGWWHQHLSRKAALTDEKGEVTLDSVPPVNLVWLIEKPSYRTTRIDLAGDDPELATVRLLRPQTIKARIVDDVKGQLIPNSRVVCRLDRSEILLDAGERAPIINGIDMGNVHNPEQREVRIADGNLSIISDLEFQSMKLAILADGFQLLQCKPISGEEEQVVREFRLKKSDGFSVIDVDGKPAAHCNVLFSDKRLKVDLGNNLLPKETIRASGEGFVRMNQNAFGNTPVVAWSKNGYGLRAMHELGPEGPLQLEPWSTLTLEDADQRIDSPGSIVGLNYFGSEIELVQPASATGKAGECVFQNMACGRYAIALATWRQNQLKQSASMQVRVASGQNKRFSPLGRNRVRGQIDLSTLGQDFLSEHSIRMRAVCVLEMENAAIIHLSEVGSRGEFSFEHLRAGNYQLDLSALLLQTRNYGTRISKREPIIECHFEIDLQASETEKDLGLIPCVLMEPNSGPNSRSPKPIVAIEKVSEIDDFKNDQPIRFVTLESNRLTQTLSFWSKTGEALRRLSTKLDMPLEQTARLEFAPTQSRFYVSTSRDISVYDTNGVRSWTSKWNGRSAFRIAGSRGDDLIVYHPWQLGVVAILSQASSNLKKTRVPTTDCHMCRYSKRDKLYWSIGKKLQSFDEDGKLVSTLDLTVLQSVANRLMLDEVNGGCWCISVEAAFAQENPTLLTRVDSTGKQVFSKYLSRSTLPKDYSMVVTGGSCFVAESKQLVRISPDGRVLSELPLVAKSLAASSDSNALWALTNDGLCKIDISGGSMVVTEKIPGVTGDQLLVLE